MFMAQATGPLYRVAFRRRRENRTNYLKRLAQIKAAAPRLVVRSSNAGFLAQIIAFDAKGDRVLARADARELEAFGWLPQANTPTAYLVGLLAGSRAKKAGVKDFHLDIGTASPSKGRTLFAAGLGAKAAGLQGDVSEELVDASRLDGSHIAAFAKSLSGDAAKYNKQFSRYAAKKIDVSALPKLFGSVKAKIVSG